jgi:hypothetical protein
LAVIDQTTGRDRPNNWLLSTKQLAAIDQTTGRDRRLAATALIYTCVFQAVSFLQSGVKEYKKD